jgi:hypothetical protein
VADAAWPYREETAADRHQRAGHHQQPDRRGRPVGEPGDVDLQQHRQHGVDRHQTGTNATGTAVCSMTQIGSRTISTVS